MCEAAGREDAGADIVSLDDEWQSDLLVLAERETPTEEEEEGEEAATMDDIRTALYG